MAAAPSTTEPNNSTEDKAENENVLDVPNDGTNDNETDMSVFTYTSPFFDMTEEEQTALTQFRAELTDEENAISSDWCCIRFLVAREWKVSLAAEMRKLDIHVRKHRQFDRWYLDETYQIPSDPMVTALMRTMKQGTETGGCYGRDRAGNPICYGFYGEFISRPLWKYISSEEYTRTNCCRFEAVLNVTMKQSNKPQFMMVMDLSNLTLEARHNARFITDNGKFNELHYPEFFYKVVCVNAPKIVTVLYNLIKPILPERTKSKIEFHSVAQTRKILDKYIAPDQLPQRFGGQVPDEICFNKPKDMSTLEAVRMEMQKAPGTLKNLKINAGAEQRVQRHCRTRSVVKWWFTVKSGDILFSIRYKADGDGTFGDNWIELRGEYRCGNDGYKKMRFPVRDTYLVQEDGIIEFVFSNKHSTWTSKDIDHCIQIMYSEQSSPCHSGRLSRAPSNNANLNDAESQVTLSPHDVSNLNLDEDIDAKSI